MTLPYRCPWKGPTVVSVGVAFILALPNPARACSKTAFWGTRGPRDVDFVGVARADTLAAGAGKVTYRIDHGHFGRGTDRPIYGQVITVEQLGTGAGAQSLRVDGGVVRQVLVVPWDYAADCHPVPWSQSARWVPATTRGLFSAVLRDTADWVAGIPTLDVHAPHATPYPLAFERDGALLRRMYEGRSTNAALTPEQLLGLYNVLPRSEASERPGEIALAPLREWMRDHPNEAARFPAPTILHSAFWEAEYERVRALQSPLAGTYRVAVVLPTGDSLIFFARTALRPTSVLATLTEDERERHARKPDTRAVGYYLAAQTALSLDGLPRSVADLGDPSLESQGYVAVVEVPALVTGDSTVWQGSIDLLQHAAHLAPAGALREAIEAAHAIDWDLLSSGQRSYAPGSFVQRSDGSVRYMLMVRQNRKHIVTMRGIRISRDHLNDP